MKSVPRWLSSVQVAEAQKGEIMRSPASRNSGFPCLLLIVAIASLVRCGDAPTEPQFQPPDPTPTPTPVALDLNGMWTIVLHGRIRLQTEVNHTGNRVTFAYNAGFGGIFEFTGTLERNLLTGRLVVDGYWRHDLSGTPTSTSIRLTGDDGYLVEMSR